MRNYDVVIVGAGPGGCMAAKVLSENGFRVALLERKEGITNITRACATMMAIENEWYINDRMYLNEKNKKIVFPKACFSVDYDGPYSPFYTWNLFSPDGKCTVHLGNYTQRKSQGKRLSVTYSKQRLLEMLLADARGNGCDIFAGTNVTDVQRMPGGIQVHSAEGNTFAGTFVIAADGVNSHIAKITGLNKKRNYYGLNAGMGIYFNNFDMPFPDAFNWMAFYHHKNGLPMAMTILPCPYPDAEFWLWGSYTSCPPHEGPSILDEVMYLWKNCPYAHWFNNSEVVRYNCHILSMWSPAPEPFIDNVIFVGDSAWTAEAECTGSMMCGHKAAHAITLAFRENKLNRDGVESYLTWWKETFPDFHDYKDFLGLFAMFEVMEEDDINYLFSLLEGENLEPTLNPYRAGKIMNGVVMSKIGQIEKENPTFMAKLQKLATSPVELFFRDSARKSFPND